MDFKEIGSKIVLGLNKAKFNLSKNSPEIPVVAGSIGVVVGAVMACLTNYIIEKEQTKWILKKLAARLFLV